MSNGKGPKGGEGPAMKFPSDEDLKAIIQRDDTQLLIERAEELGRGLARQLSTAQIRNIFGTVRQIEMGWREEAGPDRQRWAQRQLLLLKPKLAYQAKKERGRGVEDLARVLSPAIDLVGDSRDNFQRFVDFFEAILAYHKAYGGA